MRPVSRTKDEILQEGNAKQNREREFVDTVIGGSNARETLTLPGTKQFSAQALQTTRRASGPAFFF